MAEHSLWERSLYKEKKIKIFMYGPPGTFKTRTALRLGAGNGSDPALAVIDTEFGTDQYAGEFNFLSSQHINPDDIFQAIKELSQNPKSIKTLVLDTFSVYHEALTHKFIDLYLKREIRSSGHKVEYFTLSPKDYLPINREASNFVRFLIKCDLNIIVTAQAKDKWGDNMSVVGATFDGWKRLPYYFDIVIEIIESKGKFKAIFHKDRTNHFDKSKEYEWTNDKEASEMIIKALGYKLADGPKANSFVPDEIIDTTIIDVTDPAKEAATKATATAEGTKDLLWAISTLKNEQKISTDQWEMILKPYAVPSAKALNELQLIDLKHKLEAMRPTQAAQAA